ncbi:uncharacterized protein LOC122264046 [Penaeus japonicus]|uniref:uncharacterized protein LOC122264046 n=1 Tax=Penaeus japonicus TaxID=27405 RepID=UPI001C70DBD6|nr:uncharacterized protein LOC122264046 [Penaeus japonicus]
MVELGSVRCVGISLWKALLLVNLMLFGVEVEAGEITSQVYQQMSLFISPDNSLYLQQMSLFISPDNSLYLQQMSLPSFSSKCIEEELEFTTSLARFSCGAQCLHRSTCSAYCVTGEKCRLLNLAVAPGGPVSSQNGSSEKCFVPVDPSGPTSEDLARGMPVEAPMTWDGAYAPAESVVSGAVCEATEYDCYCSEFELTPVFKVDLGASKTVGRVVVRVSTDYPSNFESVYIYVGNSGTDQDAHFHTYSGNPVGGEVLSLTGAQTLDGRYVTLYMRKTFSASLCLCLMQVYAL